MKVKSISSLLTLGLCTFLNAAQAGEIGKPVTNGAKPSRTIKIAMNDEFHFKPNAVSIKKGEVVKFLVTNVGKVRHEITMGTAEELREHADMMRKMPGMKHSEPNQLTLNPGKSGQMVWRFMESGTLQFACFEPGHFEAGMKGTITVN